jgi:death-on-curing protein
VIIRFLTVAEVTEIHDQALAAYGGEPGLVAGEGLLDSAVSAPKASVASGYLHADLFEMAAAYLFHIVMDHPFMDGNKRTGSMSAVIFLKANGIEPGIGPDALRDLALDVQTKRVARSDIAEAFRKTARRKPARRAKRPR